MSEAWVEAVLAAIAADRAACRVGGDPPVPGVGWGVVGDPLRGVVRVRRIVTMGPEWIAWVDDDPAMQRRVTQSTVRALYRPGDPADAPYWRRS